MRLHRTLSFVVLVSLVCTGPAGCGKDDTCDPDTDPACRTVQSYKYVLIEDQDSATSPGVEIDAVALIKGGQTYWADIVHECAFGPGIGSSQHLDCNQAVGAPGSELGECTDLDDFFVNLGGQGGYLVVSFGDQTIEEGDTIRVYECGTESEAYRLSIGISASVTDPNWVLCGDGMTGVGSCHVPSLPQIPVE